MAHDILFRQIDKLDSFNSGEDLLNFDQSGLAAIRQIDLRYIAGDHRFGLLTYPGEEHLHLRVRRILGLVKYDE